MDLNKYQEDCKATRIYPDSYRIIYPTLKLNGEAGEIAELVGKVLRGDYSSDFANQEFKAKMEGELGDVQWYLANLATDLGLTLNDVAKFNLKKLALRKKAGTLRGSGSNR